MAKYEVDDICRSQGIKHFLAEIDSFVDVASRRFLKQRAMDMGKDEMFAEKARVEGFEALAQQIRARVQEAKRRDS